MSDIGTTGVLKNCMGDRVKCRLRIRVIDPK